MARVWCVRANRGRYADAFVKGGYIGSGWQIPDLGNIKSREEIADLVKEAYPEDKSSIVIGNRVGQIACFLLDIQAGDYVITPSADTEWLHYCRVESDLSYFYSDGADGCPYLHRRRVAWDERRLRRSELSVPLQNTLRSLLTVFAVSQSEEFQHRIGVGPKPTKTADNPYRVVLDQILELDDKEFEILVGHLLTALGFEDSEVTGKPGDGGVDVTGELNVSNLVKVKVYVQAKRQKIGHKVSAEKVRELRKSVPIGGQGAFITTPDYQAKATDIALDPNFSRIGLVNGHQLVDLLVQHWEDIPEEFRERLGLKRGLVRG